MNIIVSLIEINFIEDIDSNQLNDEIENYSLSHSRRKPSRTIILYFLFLTRFQYSFLADRSDKNSLKFQIDQSVQFFEVSTWITSSRRMESVSTARNSPQ